MSRLRTLFLALLLAAAPLMAEAGFDGHAHHGPADNAPADHAPADHHDAAAGQDLSSEASAEEDCEDGAPDHCCGDAGISCTASYLPGGAPGGATLTAGSAPLLLGRGNDPDSLHPDYDPPPPRA